MTIEEMREASPEALRERNGELHGELEVRREELRLLHDELQERDARERAAAAIEAGEDVPAGLKHPFSRLRG